MHALKQQFLDNLNSGFAVEIDGAFIFDITGCLEPEPGVLLRNEFDDVTIDFDIPEDCEVALDEEGVTWMVCGHSISFYEIRPVSTNPCQQ